MLRLLRLTHNVLLAAILTLSFLVTAAVTARSQEADKEVGVGKPWGAYAVVPDPSTGKVDRYPYAPADNGAAGRFRSERECNEFIGGEEFGAALISLKIWVYRQTLNVELAKSITAECVLDAPRA